MLTQRIRSFLGVPGAGPHTSEQVVATIGGFMSIIAIMLATTSMLGLQSAVVIVPSMGASTVLVFAAPHSVFAQPWSVLGGNLFSALVGVASYRYIPHPEVAAAVAVAGAIAIMHLSRSLHPPGGATALAAVIGGPTIHELGFGYVLVPVALNCLIMLTVALAFNGLFAWRRYPSSLMRFAPAAAAHRDSPSIEIAHIREAIDRLNIVVDVNEEELRDIIDHALEGAARDARLKLPVVELGRFYCNDRPGQQWSVRQIIDERRSDVPQQDLVIYKVVDGDGLNRTGSCTREEFARWVGSELQPRT
jgi:CBS domain-containing membrane protein